MLVFLEWRGDSWLSFSVTPPPTPLPSPARALSREETGFLENETAEGSLRRRLGGSGAEVKEERSKKERLAYISVDQEARVGGGVRIGGGDGGRTGSGGYKPSGPSPQRFTS